MKEESQAAWNWVDFSLIGMIGLLAVVLLGLGVPTLDYWFQLVLDVENWPFWIWTCLGVVILCVLLWLRSRYE